MTDTPSGDAKMTRVIEQIVELQREFFYENKGRDADRKRKLRDIIERATPSGEA